MAIWWSSAIDDPNNWDLHAVVRGCSATTSAALDPFHSYPTDHFFISEGFVEEEEEENGSSLFPDIATTNNALHHELEELCKPYFSKAQVLSQQERLVQELHKPDQPQPRLEDQTHRRVSQRPPSKRRKNQQKKVVCQVPADGLSSDMWAWRKYGQKPIKGSPFPRGYYRCSSSKGCLARKQVERSRIDPTMLIITYTAEHNHPVPTHRNSLAGTTRSKFPTLTSQEGEQNLAPDNRTSSSPLLATTVAGLSPTTPLTASMEDELLTTKVDPHEENDDDEDDGMASVREVMNEEDMVFMDSKKFSDDIDDDDFVKQFLSNIWQVEGSAMAGVGNR